MATIPGTDSNDFLYGTGAEDSITGGLGSDRLYGQGGNDTLEGGAENDFLYGHAGDDLLIGGAGNDYLTDGSGNDTLDGGAGDDTIYLGDGDDVLLYDLGDGHDTINVMDTDTGFDQVIFGAGITLSDLSVTLLPWNRDYFQGFRIDIAGQGSLSIWERSSVDSYVLSDGTTLSYLDIMSLISATPGPDTLYGGNGDDMISGGLGDDHIRGAGGNDSLYGGANSDTLLGGAGNDQLYGGSGADRLDGGTGSDSYHYAYGDGDDTLSEDDTALSGDVDRIVFGAGITPATVTVNYASGARDILIGLLDGGSLLLERGGREEDLPFEQVVFDDGTVWSTADLEARLVTDGDDTLYGSALDDSLRGGGGDDALVGAGGEDTYFYDFGDGNDTIHDEGGLIQLGAGIDPFDLSISAENNGTSMRLSFTGSGSILLANALTTGATPYQIVFSDGLTISSADLVGQQDTSGDDSLTGDTTDDNLDGGLGNDTLTGLRGEDTLIGGQGDDLLIGGDGSDLYIYRAGDGNDTISDDGRGDDIDIIQLGAGIDPTDVSVSFSEDGYDLLLTLAGDGSLLLENATIYYRFRPAALTFDDGTVWGYDDLTARAATAGDDRLFGDDRDDTLAGGAGNDSLAGRSGDDVYVIAQNEGNDTVSDTGGSDDRLLLGSGITPDTITLTEVDSGRDLLISFAGGGSVQLDGVLNRSASQIETIVFGDGTIWHHDDLLNRLTPPVATDDTATTAEDGRITLSVLSNDTDASGSAVLSVISLDTSGTAGTVTINPDGTLDYDPNGAFDALEDGETASDSFTYTIDDGTGGTDTATVTVTITGVTNIAAPLEPSEGDDTLTGTAASDTINGLGGNDLIDGGALDDVLSGGADDDTLIGGTGNDTLEGDSGNDLLQGGSGRDRLFGDTGDDTLMGGQDADYLSGGADWDLLIGDTGSDTLRGGTGNDEIIAGGGNDYVHGGDHNDTISGDWGNDMLEGGRGHDALSGGVGHDTITGGTGHDTLNGDEGNDWLYGWGGNDFVNGGSGDDLMMGGAGRDTLVAGSGDDTLTGGAHQDTFRILTSAGAANTITDFTSGEDQLDISRLASVILTQTAQGVVVSDGAGISVLLDGQTLAGLDLDADIRGTVREIDASALSTGTVIEAPAQDQVIRGGSGNDTLSGGWGNDTFVFAPGGGVDRVRDFVHGADMIGLDGFAGGDPVVFAQSGADVTMTVDSVLVAVFEDQLQSDFGAADYSFI